MKGFHLSFIIFGNVLTAKSSSGDSVESLSRTISTTVFPRDWCITNLTHGWQVSIQGGNRSLSGLWYRSAVVMSDSTHPRFIALSLFMLLGLSLIWIAPVILREYQWGSRSINLTSLGELLGLKPLTLYRLFVCLDHLRSSHESPCSWDGPKLWQAAVFSGNRSPWTHWRYATHKSWDPQDSGNILPFIQG